MNLEEARLLAIDLMAEHMPHLKDWVFAYDNAKRRMGQCNYKTKTISLSRAGTEIRELAEVRNTILHEIAHALDPKSRGHGKKWKQIAKSIGCTGERCYTGNIHVEGKYIGVCPNNPEHVYYRYNKPTRHYSCGFCSKKFDKNNIIIFKPVEDYGPVT